MLRAFSKLRQSRLLASVTKFTPYELLFGRKLVLTSRINCDRLIQTFCSYDNFVQITKHKMLKAHQWAKENIESSKEKTKIRFARSLNVKEYKVGEQVLILNETLVGVVQRNWNINIWNLMLFWNKLVSIIKSKWTVELKSFTEIN